VARARFVLRYQGEGAPPRADLARVEALPGATVVDSTPEMLLVECEPEPLRQLVEALPSWVVAPEQTYPVPDPRERLAPPE
jgi:hypothetical protein